MSTQVILLERVENLGAMGEVVKVRPGYARNYLLPQGKALRATQENIAYFEAQKSTLEKLNAQKKAEAEKEAKKIDGLKIVIVRQASESGQLYGSVTSRDISDAINASGKGKVERNQVSLNQNFKTIGLFPVDVALHPEVKVVVTANIARTEEEAKTQEKLGRALIAEEGQPEAPKAKPAEPQVDEADFLEDEVLQAREAEKSEPEEEKAAAQA